MAIMTTGKSNSLGIALAVVAGLAGCGGATSSGAPGATGSPPSGSSTASKPFEDLDCEKLAKEAVRVSSEQEAQVRLIKVRGVKVRKDNRMSFKKPTGDKSALVMSCKGTGVWSDGDDRPVLVNLSVDADGDEFVEYKETVS